MSLLAHLSLTTQLVTSKLTSKITGGFQSKIKILYESGPYTLKTADNEDELESVLKVRHQVFCRELQNKTKLFQIELDQYDLKCDHLFITNRLTAEVVGTYRLLSSHFFKKFYSEGEFQLGQFLAVPGEKLELGRACILPDHRNGAVIQLLWRGICEYMKKTDTRFLFGCSSIQTLEPTEIQAAAQYLVANDHTDDQYSIRPVGQYHPIAHDVRIHFDQPGAGAVTAPAIPPLLQSYLRAGAKLSPLPAIDRDFQCIDFFTMMDRETMNPLFRRRFFGT